VLQKKNYCGGVVPTKKLSAGLAQAKTRVICSAKLVFLFVRGKNYVPKKRITLALT